jgi:GH24 family phage-related lysozyme (muramidase)
MAPCLALLKAFEPQNATPQQTIAAAAAYLNGALNAEALAELNDGQFAALIDNVIWRGQAAFAASNIFAWVQGGNFTLPVATFTFLGARGAAERDVWNIGNST